MHAFSDGLHVLSADGLARAMVVRVERPPFSGAHHFPDGVLCDDGIEEEEDGVLLLLG